MPTVLNVDGFRFFFYSDEGNEPCHIHVIKGGGKAKIRLKPTYEEAYFYGFTTAEKRRISEITNGYLYLPLNVEKFNKMRARQGWRKKDSRSYLTDDERSIVMHINK